MVLSSSSLSEPPEELLSEAAGGTLLFASEAASADENRVKKQLLPAALERLAEASRGSTLTALAVVLIGLFAGVAAARVHRRAAPGPGICTGTGNS